MDERDVKKEYMKLEKKVQFAPYVENIERLKSSITPKKNMELKSLLVGASHHEGSLQSKSLELLKKKIDQLDSSMSKENQAKDEKMNQLMTRAKIQHSRSIRYRKLRNKYNKTKKFKKSNLSPIQEGSKETDSRSRSPWRTSMPRQQSKKKWFFGLF
jgi:hypothetical protein